MRSNLVFEATTASERTLTLVGREPSGVGGAQRRGGEVSLPIEKGWVAPLLTPVTLLSFVLPSVTTRYCYESNNND